MTADEVIAFFNMLPLPEEGGYYRETYRAEDMIPDSALPDRYSASRCFGTAILYLLTPDAFSALHRLPTDEIFHFYAGDPATMLQLLPDGTGRTVTLGSDFLQGQQIQLTVPHGVWQGMFLNEGGKWALMGTTVSPGFEFADYHDADRDELIRTYPDFKDLITRLTRV